MWSSHVSTVADQGFLRPSHKIVYGFDSILFTSCFIAIHEKEYVYIGVSFMLLEDYCTHIIIMVKL